MEHSFSNILNPTPSNASSGAPQVLLEATRQPVELSIIDSPIGPAGDSSKKRPASRIKSSYPRKRAIQACQKCRVRRTKCDNLRPTCSSCLDLGVECNYSEADPVSMQPASPFSRNSAISNSCSRLMTMGLDKPLQWRLPVRVTLLNLHSHMQSR